MIYSESDLIVPALTLLSKHIEQGLTTSQLVAMLQSELDVSAEDLRILNSRNDTYFSQKVRNLVSHRNLVNKGLATYERVNGNGVHKITEKGIGYISDHELDYNFLMGAGFNEEDRKLVIENDFDNLIIEEGYAVAVQQKAKRKRSRRLTEIARTQYMVDGKINCRGCNFIFNDFYGETAKNYIEIHHLKPIFTYEGNDLAQSLKEALKNVCPLCANCHRMAHRDPGNLLSVSALNDLVKSHGAFEPLT